MPSKTPTLDYIIGLYGWNRLRRAGLVELLIAMDEAMIAGNESARVACEQAIYAGRWIFVIPEVDTQNGQNHAN